MKYKKTNMVLVEEEDEEEEEKRNGYLFERKKKQREINARLCKKWDWREWGTHILECRFLFTKAKVIIIWKY